MPSLVVAAVSIWMGGPDTERMCLHADALPPETRVVRRESPEFTGLVIAALYRSPEPMISGRTLIGADTARNRAPACGDGPPPVGRIQNRRGPNLFPLGTKVFVQG